MGNITITGGELKGQKIAILPREEARYTSSKIREAMFNIIKHIENYIILDLFAGSGSFSIEALSRRAKFVTCVEKDKNMFAILIKNIKKCSLEKHSTLLNMDIKYAIPFLHKKGYIYDIIFMDPPYEKDYIFNTMLLLNKHTLHNDDTIFILEHSKREPFDISFFDNLEELVMRKYGDTMIRILKSKNTRTRSCV
jgi:16S rRNA (guanine966-N2)-methyltransferase